MISTGQPFTARHVRQTLLAPWVLGVMHARMLVYTQLTSLINSEDRSSVGPMIALRLRHIPNMNLTHVNRLMRVVT